MGQQTRSVEELTKENLELRKALSQFSEAGVIDLALAQQLIGGGSKAASALVEVENLLVRKGKDKTVCGVRLKTAIKTVREFTASISPQLLLK